MQAILLDEITEGEKFHLSRRRKGLTQAQSSKLLAFPVVSIRDMEMGNLPVPKSLEVDLNATDSELCYIARRRSGLTQRQLATRLGKSHVAIIKMESGEWNCELILEYFKNMS